MTVPFDPARRSVLRALHGRPRAHTPVRPPWSVAEASFVAGCTRCDACIDACPEAILIRGDGGFPEVVFQRGACTFCGDCAQACPEPVFVVDPVAASAWSGRARIGTKCFTHAGVYCRSCGDACDTAAITFRPAHGSVPTPHIDTKRCTGCGACVSVCPATAIEVRVAELECA